MTNLSEFPVYAPLLVKRIPGRAHLDFPSYESDAAAGFDLRASFSDPEETHILSAGKTLYVGCGFSFGIPAGHQLEIRPRSGHAFNFGITILNSPGTIDSDFTGEVVLMLCRPMTDYAYDVRKPLGEQKMTGFCSPISIRHGDRIAQAVLMPVVKADFRPTDELPITSRGDKGLGSTGVK